MKQSTFTIIGERYLDTQHDMEYLETLEKELANRGISGVWRWFYEYIAASGLWWNVLWWKWRNLDEEDIKKGWFLNVIFFSVPTVLSGYAINFMVGLSVLLFVHLVTIYIGLSIRN